MQNFHKKLLHSFIIMLSLIHLCSIHAALQIGGGAADIDVDVTGLLPNIPFHSPSGYAKRVDKRIWPAEGERGKYTEDLTDELFLTAASNLIKPHFRFARCNGKYNIESDNGFDGFYILLDSDDNVAKLSASGNLVKGTNREAITPVIIITESKYKNDGALQFGPGINGAAQMSEAWIRYVAYNLILNNRERDGLYPITANEETEPNYHYREHTCAQVSTILDQIVDPRSDTVTKVFRLATLLDGDANFSVHVLCNDPEMQTMTQNLLAAIPLANCFLRSENS